jgi:hypothetical protein
MTVWNKCNLLMKRLKSKSHFLTAARNRAQRLKIQPSVEKGALNWEPTASRIPASKLILQIAQELRSREPSSRTGPKTGNFYGNEVPCSGPPDALRVRIRSYTATAQGV